MKKIVIAAALAISVSPALADPQPPAPGMGKAVLEFLRKSLQVTQSKQKGAAGAAPAFSTYSTLDYTRPTSIAVGWHYAHASTCGWVSSDGQHQWFFVFPNEGQNKPYELLFDSSAVFQGLQASCNHGGVIWWYVTDSTTGAFDMAFSQTE
jgi:hypothetical protein